VTDEPIRMRLVALVFLGLITVMTVAGCAIDQRSVGATFGQSLATTPGEVDAATAARLISAYRAQNGLPLVVVDQRLMHIAADHARRMASANRLAHVLPGEGSFPRRLAAGGFNASVAAEDIGAGYRSLAAALAGWRRSPAHNANLLRAGVTAIGIAVFDAPASRYKTYWSLVLAAPYLPPVSGPTAGPFMMLGR